MENKISVYLSTTASILLFNCYHNIPSRSDRTSATDNSKDNWKHFCLWLIDHDASLSVCRHGQEGALAPPSGNVKCFCILVVTEKRSVDELRMHYFHNFSSASGDFAPKPHRKSIPGPRWGTVVRRPLICPPLEKVVSEVCISCMRPWTHHDC